MLLLEGFENVDRLTDVEVRTSTVEDSGSALRLRNKTSDKTS